MDESPRTPSGAHQRRLRASLGALAAVAVSMLLFPPPAMAQELTAEASDSAWFWSSNTKVTTCTRLEGPAAACVVGSAGDGISGGTSPGIVAPISPGHVGVGMKDGSSDMRGYLRFDISSIPFDREIVSFVVTLTVSDPNPERGHLARHAEFSGDPPATLNQRAAGIIACAVTENWPDTAFGGEPPYSTTVERPAIGDDNDVSGVEVFTEKNEPFSDCSLNASGRPSEDGSVWTFDITHIAEKWVTFELFNEGIALLPVDEGIRPTWTVEFHGPAREVQEDEDRFDVVNDEEAARAVVRLGGTIPIDDGTPPPPPPSGPPVSIPPPPPIFPDVTPPPPPADPGGPPQVVMPVSGTGAAETPAWLFGLIPIGLLGLGLTSSAIGTEGAATAAGNRVASVLKARRLGTVAGEVEPFESGT